MNNVLIRQFKISYPISSSFDSVVDIFINDEYYCSATSMDSAMGKLLYLERKGEEMKITVEEC